MAATRLSDLSIPPLFNEEDYVECINYKLGLAIKDEFSAEKEILRKILMEVTDVEERWRKFISHPKLTQLSFIAYVLTQFREQGDDGLEWINSLDVKVNSSLAFKNKLLDLTLAEFVSIRSQPLAEVARKFLCSPPNPFLALQLVQILSTVPALPKYNCVEGKRKIIKVKVEQERLKEFKKITDDLDARAACSEDDLTPKELLLIGLSLIDSVFVTDKRASLFMHYYMFRAAIKDEMIMRDQTPGYEGWLSFISALGSVERRYFWELGKYSIINPAIRVGHCYAVHLGNAHDKTLKPQLLSPACPFSYYLFGHDARQEKKYDEAYFYWKGSARLGNELALKELGELHLKGRRAVTGLQGSYLEWAEGPDMEKGFRYLYYAYHYQSISSIGVKFPVDPMHTLSLEVKRSPDNKAHCFARFFPPPLPQSSFFRKSINRMASFISTPVLPERSFWEDLCSHFSFAEECNFNMAVIKVHLITHYKKEWDLREAEKNKSASRYRVFSAAVPSLPQSICDLVKSYAGFSEEFIKKLEDTPLNGSLLLP